MRLAPLLMSTLCLAAILAASPASGAPACLDGTLVVEDQFASYTPACVIVSSGSSVAWFNKDLGQHNPSSADAGRQCFSVTQATGDYQGPFELFEVQLDWDGGALLATILGVQKECIAEGHESTYTVVDGNAHIPFLCALHQQHVGVIIVEPR